jgi:hypothetical protein
MDNRYIAEAEVNVEGLVSEFLSQMPWNDRPACWQIIELFTALTGQLLGNRDARLAQEDREQERGEDD